MRLGSKLCNPYRWSVGQEPSPGAGSLILDACWICCSGSLRWPTNGNRATGKSQGTWLLYVEMLCRLSPDAGNVRLEAGKEVEGTHHASTAGSDLWTAEPGVFPAEASRNAPQASKCLQPTWSLANVNVRSWRFWVVQECGDVLCTLIKFT